MARVRVTVRNARALQANLYAADRALQARVVRTVEESAERAYAYAYPLVPVDEHPMQDRLKVIWSPGHYAYELGWEESDFLDFQRVNPLVASYSFPELDVAHYFYPAMVVFGTVGHPPQDPLTPTFARERPLFDAALRRDLRAEVRAQGRGSLT